MQINATIKVFSNHQAGILMLLVLSIAVWLRFKGLLFQSYWLDEMETLYLANPDNSLWQVIKFTLKDKTTPLYQISLWSWFHLTGFTEYAGRALSAVIGIFSVLAIFFLVRDHTNTGMGLYAALLVSTNKSLIYFSQEVRSYQLLFLFSTLAILFLFRFLKLKSRREFWIYTLCCIGLVQTHYFGILIYTSLAGLFFLSTENRTNHGLLNRQYFYINVVITGMSLLPAVPQLIKNSLRDSFWIPPPEPYFFFEYFYFYFGNYLLSFACGILFLTGVFHLYKCKNSQHGKILHLALLMLLFVYILPFLKSVFHTPMLIDKYTIGAFPVIILLTCIGLGLIKKTSLRVLAGAILIALNIKLLFLDINYYGSIQKEQYREALQIISEIDDSPVVFCYHIRGLKIYSNVLGHDLDIRQNNINSLDDRDDLGNSFWFITRGGEKDEWEMLLDDSYQFKKRNDIEQPKIVERHLLKLFRYKFTDEDKNMSSSLRRS